MLSNHTVTVTCIWEQEKHYMNSTNGLSLISSCFWAVQKRKIHVRSSSRTKHPPATITSDCGKSLILLPQPWSYWLLLQEEWVTPTAIHGEQRDLFLPASWLSSNQILIGCSHFTTHKQYLAEVKKVNLSCFGERNKDWSAGVKACRQKNCIGNSNYYSQKPHNSDLLG